MSPPPCILLANGDAAIRVLAHALEKDWPIERLVLNEPARQRGASRLLELAASAGIPHERWSNETREALIALGRHHDDLWLLSVYFGHILPASILEAFGGRAVNVHPSLLPWGRGSNTNVWTLLEGRPAGATLHLMDTEVDRGPILAQCPVPSHLSDTAGTLYKRLQEACAELVVSHWPEIGALLPGVPQEGAGSHHASREFTELSEVSLDTLPEAQRFFDLLRAKTFPPYRGLRVRSGTEVVEARIELRQLAGKDADQSPAASSDRATARTCDLPPVFTIAGHSIGSPDAVFVVAEMSANHLGSIDRALAILRAAAQAGADAVKLQTYSADTITLDADLSSYRLEDGPWAGRSLHELYTEASTPWDWFGRLREAADDAGVVLFSTPFDKSAVEFLEAQNVPAFKIASFEIVDLPLLRAVGETGKPVILSTGLATFAEIGEAVATLQDAGCPGLALLHCTSAYPASAAEADLVTIPALSDAFGVPVGLSDHTIDISVPTAAAALGATVLEKHLTLRRDDGGPDAAFSLEPGEFEATAKAFRTAAAARGSVRDGPTPGEAGSLRFRRSLIATRDIPAGTPIRRGWVRSLRPAIGMHPRYLDRVVGRRAAVDIRRGEGLTWDALDPEPSP